MVADVRQVQITSRLRIKVQRLVSQHSGVDDEGRVGRQFLKSACQTAVDVSRASIPVNAPVRQVVRASTDGLIDPGGA